MFDPLTGIIDESLSGGVLPEVLKLARGCPLFKGGDLKNPSIYRPISLLPVISKLLQKIVHEQPEQVNRLYLTNNLHAGRNTAVRMSLTPCTGYHPMAAYY